MQAQVVPIKRGLPKLPFFDYLVPTDLENEIKIGQLVSIPLRSKSELGIVFSFSNEAREFKTKIKPIEKIIYSNPLISPNTLQFYKEISELYFCSLGSILKSSLPPLQKSKLKKLPTEIINFETSTNNHKKPEVILYDNPKEKDEIIKKLSNENGQTLILVPEISDVNNLITNLNKKETIACGITSELTNKEYFEIWQKIWQGNINIIVGTRNAIFLSFKNLKNIIVDQSFNSGHKSWDAIPRFHVRDAAIMAARHYQVPTYFISHTPSVDEYFFVKNNVYIGKLVRDIKPIKIFPTLINSLQEKRAGNYGLLGLPIIEAIEKISGSVFIYCNRRGSAAHVSCKDCKSIISCLTCSKPLVYFENFSELRCQFCNNKKPMQIGCLVCKGTNLMFYGAGVDAIIKELKKLFPNDNRSIIKIEKNNEVKANFDQTKNYLIVGTQFAWPIVDWKKISVLVFADADAPLFTPEYRSTEELWQKIHDAAYRLPQNADFFIETSKSEHLVYSSLSEPSVFYDTELKERKIFNYPPHRFLLKLYKSFPNRSTGLKESSTLYQNLIKLTKNSADIKINQPTEIIPSGMNHTVVFSIIAKLSLNNYKQSLRHIYQQLNLGWKCDPNPDRLFNE